jgi:hypothetical protein
MLKAMICMVFILCFLSVSVPSAQPWECCWLAAGAVLDNAAGLLRAGIVLFFLSQLTDGEADDL